MIFGLQLHWGEPKHPTEIRSWITTLGHKPRSASKSILSHCFMSHEVVKWYGISYRRVWFLGFCLFGVSNDQRSPELPSYVTAEERQRFDNYDQYPVVELEDDDE